MVSTRPLRTNAQVRRLNRQLHHRTPGSNRREITRRKLSRVHARTANLRRDALHKLTTTLATQNGTIVVEQLNLAGMLQNRRLARSLADAGLAELRRQLAYKTAWYGSRLVVADRFYPSSKTCSACGWVKAKLTLAERTFTCEACGLRVDQGPERLLQPRQARAARRPEWLGDVKRSWGGHESRNLRAGRDEARSRHWVIVPIRPAPSARKRRLLSPQHTLRGRVTEPPPCIAAG